MGDADIILKANAPNRPAPTLIKPLLLSTVALCSINSSQPVFAQTQQQKNQAEMVLAKAESQSSKPLTDEEKQESLHMFKLFSDWILHDDSDKYKSFQSSLYENMMHTRAHCGDKANCIDASTYRAVKVFISELDYYGFGNPVRALDKRNTYSWPMNLQEIIDGLNGSTDVGPLRQKYGVLFDEVNQAVDENRQFTILGTQYERKRIQDHLNQVLRLNLKDDYLRVIATALSKSQQPSDVAKALRVSETDASTIIKFLKEASCLKETLDTPKIAVHPATPKNPEKPRPWYEFNRPNPAPKSVESAKNEDVQKSMPKAPTNEPTKEPFPIMKFSLVMIGIGVLTWFTIRNNEKTAAEHESREAQAPKKSNRDL